MVERERRDAIVAGIGVGGGDLEVAAMELDGDDVLELGEQRGELARSCA